MKYAKKYILKISLMLCLTALFAGIFPVRVSAAAKSFNQNKTIQITEEKDFAHTQKATWIKYKAPNNGYITITAKYKAKKAGDASDEDFSTGVLRLYDSKKKTPLSGDYTYNTAGTMPSEYTVVYGVKKGTSYFLQVQAQGAVSVKCSFTKVAKSASDKKAKAAPLAKNKEAKGILMAGDGTADWYKITVPKKQYLHFYYGGKANGQIQLTFSGTYLNTAKRYIVEGQELEGHAYTIERVQPGTYYVKVERADSTSSGYYTLKWQ